MQKTHEITFWVPISVVDRCSQISVLAHRWLSHGLGFKKMWADRFVRESWVNFVLPRCFLMRSRLRVFSEREPRARERERRRTEKFFLFIFIPFIYSVKTILLPTFFLFLRSISQFLVPKTYIILVIFFRQ